MTLYASRDHSDGKKEYPFIVIERSEAKDVITTSTNGSKQERANNPTMQLMIT